MKAQHLVTIAPSPLDDIFDGIPVSPVFRNLDLAHTTFQARPRSRQTAELLRGRQHLVINLFPRPCAQLRNALVFSHLRMTFSSALSESFCLTCSNARACLALREPLERTATGFAHSRCRRIAPELL